MNLFDGLFGFEKALLMGGGLVLVVLLIALMRLVFTNRAYVGLLPFFVFPVAMMGFPEITKIQIEKDSIEIDKVTHQLQSQPQDSATRATLEADVAKLSQRPIQDPTILNRIAQAQFALGHDNEAAANVSKVLSASPSLPEDTKVDATKLQKKIDLTKNLTALTAQAESQPNNPQVQEQLKSTYTQLSQTPLANPKALETMSKAKMVLQRNASVVAH